MSTTYSRPDHDSNTLLGLGSSDGLGPVACATCGERPYYTRSHIDAAVASERERLTAACNAYAVRLRAMPPAKLPTPVEVANDLRDLAQGLGPNTLI